MMVHWRNIRLSRLRLFVVSVQVLRFVFMSRYFFQCINVLVIYARKHRPIKCLDKHNLGTLSIMDLHSFTIYHLIKFLFKLNRMSGINSSFSQNR